MKLGSKPDAFQSDGADVRPLPLIEQDLQPVRLHQHATGLEQQQALELVLSKLKDTQSNAEFLMVISKTTPSGSSLADADDDSKLA